MTKNAKLNWGIRLFTVIAAISCIGLTGCKPKGSGTAIQNRWEAAPLPISEPIGWI